MAFWIKRFIFLIIYLVIFPQTALAVQKDSFVTIVNPVRISHYNNAPAKSLAAQYREVRKHRFPATWLLTFDALDNPEVIAEVKGFDLDQEIGLFLEVTPNFADTAGIVYHNTGSWHFANAVFFSGYTQEERKKLIESIFEKYKSIFGVYPASVGSWWTDSFSLNYMKEKYGILNNLGCADQFSTDGYQLWGQYWSVPYYPSKYHTAVPASGLDNKIDVLNFQWAARDPLHGYLDSTYSTQDYFTRPKQGISYFNKLVELFTESSDNQFGQITIGLEADFDPQTYAGEYRRQLQTIADQDLQVTTMKSFSQWYRSRFPDLSPSHRIASQDLLGSEVEAVWYQSPYYRIGYTIENDRITIRDLRIYYANLRDPYWDFPNGEKILHINLPALIDQVQDGYAWTLPVKATVKTAPEKLDFIGVKNLPKFIRDYPELRIDNTSLIFPVESLSDGHISGWDSESVYFFKQVKFPFLLLRGQGWEFLRKRKFWYSQEEQVAINKLVTLKPGKILVYSNHCLQCDWHSSDKPAIFANNRSYIGKSIVMADKLLDTPRDQARQRLMQTGVDYVYLVKYGDYLEYLPYSPGDWGVELIFENANVQIWKVK